MVSRKNMNIYEKVKQTNAAIGRHGGLHRPISPPFFFSKFLSSCQHT